MMESYARYEQRMQRYRFLLREAEVQRLVKGSGGPATATFRSIASGVWDWLSQILFPVGTSRNKAISWRTRYSGSQSFRPHNW